jgi:hypothetical protein
MSNRNFPLCTHFFAVAEGETPRRCGSPALRGQQYCYHHHPTRARVASPSERRARRIARQSFNLPVPANQFELQITLNEIVQRLAANQIDSRRAGLLLFALQISAANLSSGAMPLWQ